MRSEHDDNFKQQIVTLVGHASLDIGETLVVKSKVIQFILQNLAKILC